MLYTIVLHLVYSMDYLHTLFTQVFWTPVATFFVSSAHTVVWGLLFPARNLNMCLSLLHIGQRNVPRVSSQQLLQICKTYYLWGTYYIYVCIIVGMVAFPINKLRHQQKFNVQVYFWSLFSFWSPINKTYNSIHFWTIEVCFPAGS